MASIQAKILTVKDKVFLHNNRKESPSCYMESIYDKDFIYTQSSLFETYNTFELLKAFTHKKNNDYIEQNPIGLDGKKRRKLKNNVELLTEVVINYDKDLFEKLNSPQKIHQEAEKLAINYFNKELGFQVLSVATHLDEHFRDDKSKRNYHSHITLLNYDFNTHKTVKRTLSKKHLVSIHEVVAEYYDKFGFKKADKTNDEIVQNLSKEQSGSVLELQKEITQKNNVISSLQEKLLAQSKMIENLKTNPQTIQENSQDKKRISELEKKNKDLSTLIKLVLEELNLSQDEISNMNIHAIDDMKEIIYKKLDMLKLYEFLNVGFAPTQEEENLNLLEEQFRNSNETPSSTINIKTDDF